MDVINRQNSPLSSFQTYNTNTTSHSKLEYNAVICFRFQREWNFEAFSSYLSYAWHASLRSCNCYWHCDMREEYPLVVGGLLNVPKNIYSQLTAV